MHTVQEALETILSRAKPLGMERVELLESFGRILGQEIIADIDLPPFDNTAVDGYAVRSQDTAGASREIPVRLSVIDELSAGDKPMRIIGEGKSIKIMTGAPIPYGADAVVMVEDTERHGDMVSVYTALHPGGNIRHAAEEMSAGTVVLSPGIRIRPSEIALLAALGNSQPLVYKQPRAALFSTGDELVDVGAAAPPYGKIRDSNLPTLAALAAAAGAEILSMKRLPDSLPDTIALLRESSEMGADMIITAGGVSVGDRDYVRLALESLGRLELWKVAMKPGKPLAFGSIGRSLFLGLPGNPISVQVTFELFARPALWKQMGRSKLERPVVRARLADSLKHSTGRDEYVRAITIWNGAGYITRSTGAQGSSILSSMTLANSLLLFPADIPLLNAGDEAEVMMLE